MFLFVCLFFSRANKNILEDKFDRALHDVKPNRRDGLACKVPVRKHTHAYTHPHTRTKKQKQTNKNKNKTQQTSRRLSRFLPVPTLTISQMLPYPLKLKQLKR